MHQKNLAPKGIIVRDDFFMLKFDAIYRAQK